MIRKTYFKTILVLFIVMSIFLSYSVVGLKKNYIFTNQSFDPLVYSPTPDWESDNPHYSTGCAWMWSYGNLIKHRHILNVITYDVAGNSKSKELVIWRFL